MKIILVSGARPNFMKIAPIIWEIRKFNQHNVPEIQCVLVHTGQHYDRTLFEVFINELNLPQPDYNLGVGSGSHAAQTAEVMIRFEPVLKVEKPDLVMVVGDVNSTVACALTAAKIGFPVAHVEAGLRSFDRTMPEEINRIMTDAISDYLFITEESANRNLLREGVCESRIFFVGNVMIDSLLKHKELSKSSMILSTLNLMPQTYGVLTMHRPSNVEDKKTFQRILDALFEISQKIPIIFPCHPRTKSQIETFGLDKYFRSFDPPHTSGLHLLDPLGYFDFLQLMTHARLILTDSGGIQEEATVLGIPCITLRANTERPVTLTEGTNIIVGSDEKKIKSKALELLNGHCFKGRLPKFWDGRAAERIVEILLDHFG